MSDLLDLDALFAEQVRPVKLFGRPVTVRPITGTTLHRVLAATQLTDVASQMQTLHAAIPHIAPELTPDEVERLTHQQVMALIHISQGDVETVEGFIKGRAGGRADGPGESTGPGVEG